MPKNVEERIIDNPFAAVRRGGSASSGGGSGGGGGGGGGGAYIEGNGIDILDNIISVQRKPISGLLLDATGIGVGAGDGINVFSSTVAVNPFQIIDEAWGLQVSGTNDIQIKRDAASGMIFGSGGGLKLGAPGDITLSSGGTVTATGHDHDIITSADVSAGTSQILQSLSGNLKLQTLDLNGNLNFMGITREINAASHLFIKPTGDLTLDPTGLLVIPTSQTMKTPDFAMNVAGIDGWSINPLTGSPLGDGQPIGDQFDHCR